jgi:hypothetical protein
VPARYIEISPSSHQGVLSNKYPQAYLGQPKEMIMKKYPMRSVPAAAAIAAALLLGVQVHAQTNTTTPPGSTKPQDQVMPAPSTNSAARAGAEAGNSSGSPVTNSATQTGGTTKPKDAVSPSPAGGVAKTPEARTAAKADRATAKAEKREKRAAKRARNSAARDAAATSTGGAQGPAAGGTK